VHAGIARRAGGGRIAGVVYGSLRGVTRLVGGGIDLLLAQLEPGLQRRLPTPEREAVVAALNGVLGDYLAASGNPLAIAMALRRGGRPFVPRKRERRVAVLVHGLCMGDLQWRRKGHDHGAALARDLGYAPAYLRYNSGLHVSVNGRAFADLLEGLAGRRGSPVAELVVVAHSMGGLVARSAFHHGVEAGHGWPARVKAIVFLGTPHHGAPLERGGNWIDIILGATPYAAPFARLGRIRSAGITDLRHGNLVDEDWAGRDRFAPARDTRRHLPLPPGVPCYAIAATTGRGGGSVRDRIVGDGLVPLDSALGRHREASRCLAFPDDRAWVARGVSHLGLLGSRAVYLRLRRWIASRSRSTPRRRAAATRIAS